MSMKKNKIKLMGFQSFKYQPIGYGMYWKKNKEIEKEPY